MELIEKDAVIAEIKELIRKNELYLDENASDPIRFQKAGAYSVLVYLEHFIDTLEVKEVDLDLEISLWAHELYEIPYDDVERMAKYFFELGLKAKGTEGICKISETNCPNFDEAQGTPIITK